MSRFAIISKNESKLFSEIEAEHKEDSVLWKVPNLVVPIGTIVLALLCLVAFSDKRFEFLNYLNLIINGSLPLIAINQISSSGSYVFKFDKSTEKRLQKDTSMLRTKLFYFSLAILVLGVLLFAFQVIGNPFSSYVPLSIMILLSVLLVCFSSFVSKRVYLLQDSFIEKTYDNQLRQEAIQKHGNSWGGANQIQ